MKIKNKNKNKSIKDDKVEWSEIIIPVIAALFINLFVLNITTVSGESMNPSFENGDRLILKKYETILKTEKYVIGDIIVFKSPLENDDRLFIKRVIGIPGDEINILDGELYINNQHIDEPYIENESFTESLLYGTSYTVPEAEVFVMGDNRFFGGSNDSRSFGSVPLENIKGKVVFRVFPFNKIGNL